MRRFNSFYEMLSYNAENYPNAVAFYYDDNGKQSVSYKDFLFLVEQKSMAYKNSGKKCVGILSDGSFDCIVNVFASNIAGLQVVMLDKSLSVPVLKTLVPVADIDTLWGDKETVDILSPLLCFNETVNSEVKEDQVLFFTSGTTSMSKAVVITGHSLCQSAYNGGALLPLCNNDTLMFMLPLAHVFGFVCGILWGFSCGAAVAIGRGARHYIDDLAFFEPTALSAVPTLFGFLLKNKLLNKNLKLVLIGGGACSTSLLDAAKSIGLKMSIGYGLTETSSGVALSLQSDNYGMDICPDDKISLASDGEILIECPTCIMKSYYKNKKDTDEVLKDGVFYTGDIGRFDKDGKLFIIGRKKEILVLGDGTKIFLPEYEAGLSKVLGTEEIVVFLKNDKPCLLISDIAILPNGKEASSISTEEVRIKIQDLMNDYPRDKQIAEILRFKEKIPRTATGKIRRWEIDMKFISH